VRPGGLQAARAAAELAARRSYGKLIAWLSARGGDLASAEDALADAFAAALAVWPASGVPERPEAWLLTTARRRLVDMARRRRTGGAAEPELLALVEDAAAAAAERADAAVPDWRLRLLFACAHPAIEPGVRGPLMMQAVLGFDAAAIAAAFLVAPATMGQRLVRAKRRIREAGIPFRVPEADELAGRLETVLQAIYAAFTAGWADPAGDVAARGLSEEAIWLARLVTALLPGEPEAAGLLALLLHADARRGARRDETGAYVPLDRQDTALWSPKAMAEAEALLRQAGSCRRPGRFQLEAAVQSVHAARRVTGRTDWPAIVLLYDRLLALDASPVAALNRAVALAEAAGPAAGLAALDALAGDERLSRYQPYWAARADLLARCGAGAQAVPAYDRAIALEPDPAVRAWLQVRRDGLAGD
jgi:RNA polymerase sigma-70 factor (ECF subfamily)